MSALTEHLPGKSRLAMQYAGSEWLERHLAAMHEAAASRPRGRCNASKIVTPLGRDVADAIGFAWRGIYHLPPSSINRAPWHHPLLVRVTVLDQISTYDADTLTRLMVACFDLRLRLEICSAGPRMIGIAMSPRTRSGMICESIPHLDDFVRQIRTEYVVREAP